MISSPISFERDAKSGLAGHKQHARLRNVPFVDEEYIESDKGTVFSANKISRAVKRSSIILGQDTKRAGKLVYTGCQLEGVEGILDLGRPMVGRDQRRSEEICHRGNHARREPRTVSTKRHSHGAGPEDWVPW